MAPNEESKAGGQEHAAAGDKGTGTKPVGTAKTEDSWGNVLGLVIWIALIVAFVVIQFVRNDATVMLDVARDKGLVASGSVVYQGKPSDGTVHIVVTNAKNKRYLSGIVVPVTNG